MFNLNSIVIKDIKDRNLNFKKLLQKCDTFIWRDCENMEIKVNSKINKFEFNDCENIKIFLLGTIAGLEINKCSNFTIILPKNHTISSLQLYKSVIKIDGKKIDFKKIILTNESSKIIFQ
jgi:hypothetical protein